MSDASQGQLTKSAAEVYDEFFVPALFAEWAPRLATAASLRPGHEVLDVACGTGVATREAAARVGAGGSVVGLDRNAGMLATARRRSPELDWREGRAEALPFDDAAFDAVLCQFGLMFFDDRADALAEMRRVLRPGGRLALAVWDGLARTPGYAAMTDLLRALFGDELAEALGAPFVLGNTSELAALFAAAGMEDASIATAVGQARFPSVDDWVRTDIKGWTLADMLDERQFARLRREAPLALGAFVAADGSVRFASPAHIATWTKP